MPTVNWISLPACPTHPKNITSTQKITLTIMELTIECKKRVEGSKPRTMRREGVIPANLYGHKGGESELLTVNAKDLEILMKRARPGVTAVEVNIPELSWKGKAVLKEIQKHPWKGFVYHVSFFAGS
jgi:large subunit ribosomal protein L25